jgi:hypothetical protein
MLDSRIIQNVNSVVMEPCWPAGQERLFLVFEVSGESQITAHAIDPEAHTQLFWAELRDEQRDAFAAAVERGVSPIPLPPAPLAPPPPPPDKDDGSYGIVVSGPGPDPGPRYKLPLTTEPPPPDPAG